MNTLTPLLLLVCVASSVYGHGYMQKPAARNCMWRFGFPNPKNYGDNENFCGGATRMARNGGKCGVCGDEYGRAQRHADGGRYANGIITARYQPGQTIDVEVLLTTSHLGYFEFRVGDKGAQGDSIGKLQGHLLKLKSGGTQYRVTKSGRYLYKMQVILPSNLTCKKCVMQWWYRGGNNWGCGKTGCGLGHGAQEHFVNCADISIGNGAPPNPQTSRPTQRPQPPTRRPQPPTQGPTEKPAPPTRGPTKRPHPTGGSGICRATGSWKGDSNIDAWCVSNCKNGYCPAHMCTCD